MSSTFSWTDGRSVQSSTVSSQLITYLVKLGGLVIDEAHLLGPVIDDVVLGAVKVADFHKRPFETERWERFFKGKKSVQIKRGDRQNVAKIVPV